MKYKLIAVVGSSMIFVLLFIINSVVIYGVSLPSRLMWIGMCIIQILCIWGFSKIYSNYNKVIMIISIGFAQTAFWIDSLYVYLSVYFFVDKLYYTPIEILLIKMIIIGAYLITGLVILTAIYFINKKTHLYDNIKKVLAMIAINAVGICVSFLYFGPFIGMLINRK